MPVIAVTKSKMRPANHGCTSNWSSRLVLKEKKEVIIQKCSVQAKLNFSPHDGYNRHLSSAPTKVCNFREYAVAPKVLLDTLQNAGTGGAVDWRAIQMRFHSYAVDAESVTRDSAWTLQSAVAVATTEAPPAR